MLKQELQQKLQQKLSPAQIQVIKMLELPTLELEDRITQELEENPALEEGEDLNEENTQVDEMTENESDTDDFGDDDFNLDEYISDDEIPDYKLKVNNVSKDDKHEDIPFSVGTTFQEYLQEQLGLQSTSERERKIAQFVIGNIDEDGYLRREVEAIVDDMAFQEGVEVSDEEMKSVVTLVQTLEPAGVGARDLRECLLLQLERRPQTESIRLAGQVLTDCFEEFSRKHYDKIQQKLGLSDADLKLAISEIIRLNPKPGSAWSGNLYEKSQTAVVPDFILENDEDELHISLNNVNIPDLRVNKSYNDMLQDYTANKQNRTREMKDAVTFVKQKIDAAKWFIDAIKQRNETLIRTMTAIVEFQKDFFIEGDETYLKPMILKDISDRTGYDISTISRVSNSKYVQTEFGVYPLKYFFSESMTNDAGEEVSTREIKKILQESINAEDKNKPLTDDQLVVVLKLQGYLIARRTVAKYREQLNIPVARLRKEI